MAQKHNANIWFRVGDIINRRSVLGRLHTLFDDRTPAQLINTIALIILPLALLSAAAIHDGRFWYGSLTTQHPEYGVVLGMSFMGDTKVWPFCILIPILLVFTAKAARSTMRSLNRLVQVIDAANVDTKTLEAIVQKTKNIFKGGAGWIRFVFLIIPWVSAISFNLYNGFTCYYRADLPNILPQTLLDKRPQLIDPYATDRILVRVTEGEKIVYQPRQVDPPVSIAKWDTDRKDAFASTATTRIWSLIFYSIAPFILVRLVLMVSGFAYFLRKFAKWVRSSNTFSLEESIVKPFSTSSFGGLEYLSETAMRHFYVSIIFVLFGALSFLKEGISLSLHNQFLLLVFLPVAIFSFAVPMIYAHDILRSMKMKYMNFIGNQQNELLFRLTADRYEGREFSDVYYKFMALKEYSSEIASMSVWPFSNATIIRLSLYILSVPVITGMISLLMNFQGGNIGSKVVKTLMKLFGGG